MVDESRFEHKVEIGPDAPPEMFEIGARDLMDRAIEWFEHCLAEEMPEAFLLATVKLHQGPNDEPGIQTFVVGDVATLGPGLTRLAHEYGVLVQQAIERGEIALVPMQPRWFPPPPEA